MPGLQSPSDAQAWPPPLLLPLPPPVELPLLEPLLEPLLDPELPPLLEPPPPQGSSTMLSYRIAVKVEPS